jgi:hypothetical protein
VSIGEEEEESRLCMVCSTTLAIIVFTNLGSEASLRGLAKITWPFLQSACYDQPYAELNDTGHCSEVYHLGATLG